MVRHGSGVIPHHPEDECTFQVSADEARLVNPGQDDASFFKNVSARPADARLTGLIKRCNTRLKIDDIGCVGSLGLEGSEAQVGWVRRQSLSLVQKAEKTGALMYFSSIQGN